MKRKQRSYVRIPTEKVEELKKEFELNQNCTAKFPELAKRLDLNVRQVRKWFENRKQKVLKKEKPLPSPVSSKTTTKSTASADTVSKSVKKCPCWGFPISV